MRGVKYTLLGFLLIILFMGIVFSFKVPLVYSHIPDGKTNVVLWPITQFNELLVYKWMGISSGNHWGSTLNFALTEIPYILLLMTTFTFLFSFARNLSTDEELTTWLHKYDGIRGRLVGVLFGMVSPFCSCSTIPLVTTMGKNKMPFSTIVSFLIVSPMINEAGIAIMWSFFGWKLTLVYIAFGLTIGILGSYMAKLFKFTSSSFLFDVTAKEENAIMLHADNSYKAIFHKAIADAKANLKKYWWILVLAMIVGAFAHGWIPESWLKQHLGNAYWAPLALIPIGMLMYLNVSATLPIVYSLYSAGVNIGSALGFLMAVNTISLPEIIILTKVFKKKFMVFYISYLLLAILSFTYIIMFVGRWLV